jgi:hypothetical protein
MTTRADVPEGAAVHGPTHSHGDSKHSHAGGTAIHAHGSLKDYANTKKREPKPQPKRTAKKK